MKKVVSLTRRAIEQYNMIEDGDKIAVGVSGGKDSLVLLNVLAELSRYYPKKFTVMGLTLDMGYDADYSKVQKMCDDLGVEYKVKKTNIKEIIFDIRKESNPCSLCAKMRRGALMIWQSKTVAIKLHSVIIMMMCLKHSSLALCTRAEYIVFRLLHISTALICIKSDL